MVMSLGKMLTESAGTICGKGGRDPRRPKDHLSGTGAGRMRPGEPPAVAGSRQGGQGGADAPQLPGVHHRLFRHPEDRRRRRDAQRPVHAVRTDASPGQQRHALPDHPGALAKRFEEIRNELPLCAAHLTTNGPEEDSPFREIITQGPFTEEIPELAGDDPAVMIYTAGLTGKPLGAVLTHHNLLTQSVLLPDDLQRDEKDIGLAVIPFFHSFGAVVNMLMPLRIGASVVLMERFTLEGIFTAIEKEKITYIAAVPRLFLGMLFQQDSEKYKTDSLSSASPAGRRCHRTSSPYLKRGSASRSWRATD